MQKSSPPAESSVTTLWGDFVARSQWSDVPASVRHEAKRSILNLVGTSLGAAKHSEIESLARLLREVAGPPQACVIGRVERFDCLSAAFINAVSANLFDFDDTHLGTVIHPSAPVAPPLLALGEQRGSSGSQILHAFVLGVEIECRLGNAVSPAHYARGCHITATCGVFGAAAASAKLIGLNAAGTAHAIGIAASQSAGIAESLATGAKNVGIGNCARNGLFAALLAQTGYTAAPRAIEGVQGWAHAVSDALNLNALLIQLGETWELTRNAYKPYPCGIVLHAVIDAALSCATHTPWRPLISRPSPSPAMLCCLRAPTATFPMSATRRSVSSTARPRFSSSVPRAYANIPMRLLWTRARSNFARACRPRSIPRFPLAPPG